MFLSVLTSVGQHAFDLLVTCEDDFNVDLLAVALDPQLEFVTG